MREKLEKTEKKLLQSHELIAELQQQLQTSNKVLNDLLHYMDSVDHVMQEIAAEMKKTMNQKVLDQCENEHLSKVVGSALLPNPAASNTQQIKQLNQLMVENDAEINDDIGDETNKNIHKLDLLHNDIINEINEHNKQTTPHTKPLLTTFSHIASQGNNNILPPYKFNLIDLNEESGRFMVYFSRNTRKTLRNKLERIRSKFPNMEVLITFNVNDPVAFNRKFMAALQGQHEFERACRYNLNYDAAKKLNRFHCRTFDALDLLNIIHSILIYV